MVIIGFGLADPPRKQIYEYPTPADPPVVTVVTNISPYLVEGGDTVVTALTRPINGAPPINYGSMMIDKPRSAGDDEGLILTPSTGYTHHGNPRAGPLCSEIVWRGRIPQRN